MCTPLQLPLRPRQWMLLGVDREKHDHRNDPSDIDRVVPFFFLPVFSNGLFLNKAANKLLSHP
jgi:hypothetical protein